MATHHTRYIFGMEESQWGLPAKGGSGGGYNPNRNGESSYLCTTPVPLLLPHYQQQGHWDCGITCLRMVLAAYNLEFTTDQLQKLCGTTSIWTADLANILFQLRVPFRFHTVTLGVCPEFINEVSHLQLSTSPSGPSTSPTHSHTPILLFSAYVLLNI
jgi:hypothetical protein